MKKINNYITEKLNISADNIFSEYPNTTEELQNIIENRIKERGPECDLNDIDVSEITDMAFLFNTISNYKNFNGDISNWDVSNVQEMEGMFWGCTKFNGDISKWDVSKVADMRNMFTGCTNFNQDLSDWDIRSIEDMSFMFANCKNFDQDLSKWDVSNVNDIIGIFKGCAKFDGANLEGWRIKHGINKRDMFKGCKTKPTWYIG